MRTKDPLEKEKAVAARDFLSGHILGKIVKVCIQGEDKYGRLLAEIFDENGDVNYSDLMLENEHAYKYDGGTKTSFKDWVGK